MANINHPNLIKFVGFSFPSKNDQNFKIYSKYTPNDNLCEILKKDQLNNEKEKLLDATKRSIIVYGIASAMAYLHKNKIVHRDLKPENVFLDEDFKPILADFGLSKICDDNLNMTNRLGTPYFMAPELFGEDEKDISNKIDVYAFAITILSLFTTNYRFQGAQPRSINQLVNKIINGKRYIIPNDVPDFYVSLIQRCWSNNIKDRPSFDDIVKELDKNDNFIFEGADKNVVHEYIKKIKNFDDSAKTNFSFNSSSSVLSDDEQIENDEYEETKEFDFNCF